MVETASSRTQSQHSFSCLVRGGKSWDTFGNRQAIGLLLGLFLHSNNEKIIKRKLPRRFGITLEPETEGHSILSLPLVYSFPFHNVNILIGLSGKSLYRNVWIEEFISQKRWAFRQNILNKEYPVFPSSYYLLPDEGVRGSFFLGGGGWGEESPRPDWLKILFL